MTYEKHTILGFWMMFLGLAAAILMVAHLVDKNDHNRHLETPTAVSVEAGPEKAGPIEPTPLPDWMFNR